MDRTLLIESSGLCFNVESSSVHSIQEEKFKTGLLRLIGVPATIVDSKNGNGRAYSTKVIEKALGVLKKNRAFENKKCFVLQMIILKSHMFRLLERHML